MLEIRCFSLKHSRDTARDGLRYRVGVPAIGLKQIGADGCVRRCTVAVVDSPRVVGPDDVPIGIEDCDAPALQVEGRLTDLLAPHGRSVRRSRKSVPNASSPFK